LRACCGSRVPLTVSCSAVHAVLPLQPLRNASRWQKHVYASVYTASSCRPAMAPPLPARLIRAAHNRHNRSMRCAAWLELTLSYNRHRAKQCLEPCCVHAVAAACPKSVLQCCRCSVAAAAAAQRQQVAEACVCKRVRRQQLPACDGASFTSTADPRCSQQA
jgi:hypothetical protein